MPNSTKKEAPKHWIGYPALRATMVENTASRFSRAVSSTQAQVPTLEPLTALVESHGETMCLPQAPDPLLTIQSLLGSLSECSYSTDYLSHQHGDCTPVPQQFASLFSHKVNTQDFQASVTVLSQGSVTRFCFLVPNLKDLVSTPVYIGFRFNINNDLNLSIHNNFRNSDNSNIINILSRNINHNNTPSTSTEDSNESSKKKRNSKKKKRSSKKSKMRSRSTLIGRYLEIQRLSSGCRGRQKTHIFGGRRQGVCGERVRRLVGSLDAEFSLRSLIEKKSGSLGEKKSIKGLDAENRRPLGSECSLDVGGCGSSWKGLDAETGSLGSKGFEGNRERLAA